MRTKTLPFLLALPLLLSLTAVRGNGWCNVHFGLPKSDESNAFLTQGQIDEWLFDGHKGETVIAHVTTNQFDPILQLTKTEDKVTDKVLIEVNQSQSESYFTFHLPEEGSYKIRVHAFKMQGGGNYALHVQRFRGGPLVLGKAVSGTFGPSGKNYYWFQAVKDHIVIPDVKGASSEGWSLLDPKGQALKDWNGSVLVQEDGEHCLVVSGQAELRHDLVVREARVRDLTFGKELSGALQPRELAIHHFQGKPGDFRVVEVERKGDVQSRLIFAPRKMQTKVSVQPRNVSVGTACSKKPNQHAWQLAWQAAAVQPPWANQRHFGWQEAGDASTKERESPATVEETSAITFLPVAHRGGRLRFAAILGGEGRYQLQLLAESNVSYKVTAEDPSKPLELGEEAQGDLPTGGAAFFSFHAVPGQLLHAKLSSKLFVPVLRLYDAVGAVVGTSEGDADLLEGRVTLMVTKGGLYRLQVSSLGDGGSGHFHLALTETKIKELQIGARANSALQAGDVDYAAFEGKEGKTIFVNVRSDSFEPSVSLRSPDGVCLVADQQSGIGTDTLFAVKLPKAGRYMLWIGSRRGAGDYLVRLIDGD